MNEVEVFNFEEKEVRTVILDNEVWLVAKDVAETLGYVKARNAIATHVDEEDKKVALIQGDLGGTQKMTVINQSGVISLALSSKLPSAKKFKRWVTSEVIPSVLKNGSYQSKPMSAIETLQLQSKAILETNERLTSVEDDVIDLKENKPVSATDYSAIGSHVNRTVYAYASIHRVPSDKRKHLFKDINTQIKQVTGAGNRSRIKSKDYDMVIQFIDNWQPSTATKTIIEQTELDVEN